MNNPEYEMERSKKIKELEKKIKELEEKNESLKLYSEVLKDYLIQELKKGIIKADKEFSI